MGRKPTEGPVIEGVDPIIELRNGEANLIAKVKAGQTYRLIVQRPVEDSVFDRRRCDPHELGSSSHCDRCLHGKLSVGVTIFVSPVVLKRGNKLRKTVSCHRDCSHQVRMVIVDRENRRLTWAQVLKWSA